MFGLLKIFSKNSNISKNKYVAINNHKVEDKNKVSLNIKSFYHKGYTIPLHYYKKVGEPKQNVISYYDMHKVYEEIAKNDLRVVNLNPAKNLHYIRIFIINVSKDKNLFNVGLTFMDTGHTSYCVISRSELDDIVLNCSHHYLKGKNLENYPYINLEVTKVRLEKLLIEHNIRYSYNDDENK